MNNIQIQNTDWLTPKQLEAEYGISQGTQYKMRMRKNYENLDNMPIPFAKVGKRVLYYKKDIENWLLNLRKGVTND